ncbi:HAMP domain-containing protein [Desulfovibrio sulfodismutans]|uniref:histidine kinase n=1 Tax=Desulfolutivibrio sulfodismutans TaxID=63561 RepID=A0A7K3NJY7_9BACT|nr:histidine kinase dimerization/phospho-acceptor domain-containing protein [Desulfolutivibrio sulfodismutans]NDY56437.1 HAMP domain-containing protein [Desulfolutivibrio sulfodismutans]QLA13803.1 HAMP domain-containing protein [Desulfolutivibrio sulfodismutans DSM 3696]
MQRPSLQVRTLFLSLTAFFFLLCLVFWFFIRQTEGLLVEDATNQATSKLELVLWLLRAAPDRPGLADRNDPAAQPAPSDRITLEGLPDWAADMGRHLGARITYIAGGKVLADTEVPGPETAELEDHAGRPEVVAALASGFGTDVRHSRTTGRQTVYAAMRADNLPGLPDGVLRVAVPYHAVTRDLARFRGVILGALGIVLLCGGFLSLLPARSLTGTIKELTLAIKALGDGDYERRLYLSDREFSGLAEAYNAMAERVGKNVAAIEGQRNRHAAVLDGLDEGLAVLCPDGRIGSHNAPLARLVGSGELDGRLPIETPLGPAVHAEVAAMLHDPQAKAATRRFTLAGDRDVEANLVPFTDQDGRRRLILTLRDITGQNRMEANIRDFVREASHRLRTPLTKIAGYLDMARGTLSRDPARAGTAIDAALRFSREMEDAVADLMAMAAARFSASMDRPPRTDVRRILENALREAAVRCPEAAPPRLTVQGDGDFVAEVEPNGLGRVFVLCLERTAASGDDRPVVLSRRDDGLGIEFPGAQGLASPAAGQVQGDGTGLPADFLAAYGGTLVPGDNGALLIRLPLAPASGSEPA